MKCPGNWKARRSSGKPRPTSAATRSRSTGPRGAAKAGGRLSGRPEGSQGTIRAIRKQQPPSAEALAIEILAQTRPGEPLDKALARKLRDVRGMSRLETGEVARLVFLYHRWRGWLNLGKPRAEQLQAAREVAARFAQNPDAFPDDELRRAVPDWIAQHVEVNPGWLRALQREPSLWLRARPGTAPDLIRDLGDAESPCALLPDAILHRGNADLFRSPAFHAGRFEIQDIASQAVSVLASPRATESWWDACAGEGGKTLHLADLMQNRGVVWATDRAEWRLRQLRLRCARAGLFNVRWQSWEGGRQPALKTRFDGVLVDAPCTGVGTWQRNPHARWSLKQGEIRELASRQVELLGLASQAVKIEGRLFYAVCSLTREETIEVCDAFQSQHPEYEPLTLPTEFRRGHNGGHNDAPGQLWLWPQDWGGNGMFVAGWRRVRWSERERSPLAAG